MTMMTLLAESAIRSLALGVAVWIVLKAARVRNAQAQITAWTIVLMAAVLMPALMRWPTVPIPAPRIPAGPAIAFVQQPVQASVNWQGVLGSCYLAGTTLLLLRVLTGLALTWRLRRMAIPVAADVRISQAIPRRLPSGQPSSCPPIAPAGLLRCARPCSITNDPTSNTATSTFSCSPVSIAPFSGSIRWRGG